MKVKYANVSLELEEYYKIKFYRLCKVWMRRVECLCSKLKIRDAHTLENIITTYVERGSIIHSDGWKGYSKLSDLGYFHDTVILDREFVISTGVHTNRIEGFWSAFKRKC